MSQTARPPDDQAGAEKTLNRFLQVWERLAAANPGSPAFQSDLATANGCVGTLMGAYLRRREAVQSYRKSIALWEILVRVNPEEPEYKVALVQAYGAAAAELSRSGHVKSNEAEEFFHRALESWEALAAEMPTAHRYRAALVNVLLLRGTYYQNLSQLENAIADYSKAIELDPNNADTHFQIGDACARLGRWDQAQAEIGKAADLDPGNHWYTFHLTVVQLHAGDLAGYRRVCRQMLKRFGDTEKPEVAERTAKTCLLVPDAVADLAPVLTLADRAVKGGNNRYFLLCKGLAEYRSGRNAEAVNWEERAAPDVGGRDLDAAVFTVLAMAQYRLGRREQSSAAFDKAEAIMAKNMADPGAGRPFRRDWDDWLRCRILLDEAGKLMKKDPGAKNQESGNKPS
jgi:tetratricopeptide (TPR) repeat protein